MKKSIKFFALAVVFLVFSPLKAQNETTVEKADTVDLKEIVVHASRDNSKLKAIPNSVSVISAEQIETLGINSLTDVTSTVANLFMPDYGSKLTSPIYIRGIGSRINAPSVGLYVDHVPYFEKAAFNFDFFDIDRIEVLRGPQGTQYGRNTMGGMVNILTKSPLNYQGSNLNLQTGNYGTYMVNASNYGRLNDKFVYSIALNYRHNDGFFTNSFLNEKVDKLDSYGIRNRMIWSISKPFSIENIFSYENSKQGGYPYALYNDSAKKAEQIAYNQRSIYNRILLSDALLLNYNVKNFNLVSTTSYQYLSDDQSIDQDFTIDSLYFVIQRQKQNMVSQEITISSKNNKKYGWLFGLYGFMQQFDNNVYVNAYATQIFTSKTYDHTIYGGALFHQSTIKDFPIRNMDFTFGVRIDTESDLLGYKYDMKKGGVFKNINDTTYKVLNSLQVLPKIALNYEVNSTNFYALLARGYKTGGFNSTFERPEDLTFEPEYSWNYEIGIKSSLLNRVLYAEVSLFYIDWKNQQIYQTVPSGRGSMLKNAGKSASKGMELGLSTSSIHGFNFSVNYGYTHAIFITNELNAAVNYNGNYIPYIPKHTLAIQAKKTIEVKNTQLVDRIIMNAFYKGNGEIYWNDKNTQKQNFYGTLDARVSFIRKKIQIDFWGSNLTNTSFQVFYLESLGKEFVQMNKPLQAGIKLSLNF